MIITDKEIEYIMDSDQIEEEEEDVCEFCDGTGEVTTMESVYPGTPDSHIQAPIGTEKCICQLDEEY